MRAHQGIHYHTACPGCEIERDKDEEEPPRPPVKKRIFDYCIQCGEKNHSVEDDPWCSHQCFQIVCAEYWASWLKTQQVQDGGDDKKLIQLIDW